MSPAEERREDRREEEQATVTVEPRLGFQEFAGIADVSMAAQAALKRWIDMYVGVYASSGHYPLAQWQDYHAQMRAHT